MGAVERSALINATMFHGEHTLIEVDSRGRVVVDGFAHALKEQPTAFAALQQANHEVGTIQPVGEIAELARTAQVPLLVDASASIGHIAAPARTDWDALVANPADWGAGSGIGILALKPRTRTRRTWPEDQDAWFPGGASLPALFAAAVTLSETERLRQVRANQHRAWIDQIRAAAAHIPDAEVVGDPHDRLPHLATFSFLYVDGEAITSELDKHGFAVGSGSACTSATLNPSHVLAAMGVLTHGNVRVALDWDVTQQDVDRFIEVLPRAVRSVRSLMGAEDL
jgi:cysteine desulfurase